MIPSRNCPGAPKERAPYSLGSGERCEALRERFHLKVPAKKELYHTFAFWDREEGWPLQRPPLLLYLFS